MPSDCPGSPFSNFASMFPFLPWGLVISPSIFFPLGVVHSTFFPISLAASSLVEQFSGRRIIWFVFCVLRPPR